jgi:UDP-N-acetylmuramate dehydrogenase
MSEFISTLEKIVSDRLKFDEPMSQFSHYQVGGPAKFFVEAKTVKEIKHSIAAAKSYDVKWVIIGGGTNILPNDKGFDGLVIRIANRSVQVDIPNLLVTAESGALSSMVARKSADAGLGGFEWAVSLPGTIGGAIRGNAGCFGGEVRETLLHADVLDTKTGIVKERSSKWFKFGYRESRIKHEQLVVLRATFKLESRSVKETKEKIKYVLQCRLKSQPKNAKCAGCAFKNFEFKDVSELAKLTSVVGEIPPNFIDKKIIASGWLIDRAELKGEAIGGASVSEKHGNFILSDGTATADHIAQLIALIKTRVRNQFGIQLQEEIQYI